MQWETIRKIFALAIAFGIGYMACPPFSMACSSGSSSVL